MSTSKTCPCPQCNALGHWAAIAADEDYYRCYSCGHVWIVQRDNPEPPNSSMMVDFEFLA